MGVLGDRGGSRGIRGGTGGGLTKQGNLGALRLEGDRILKNYYP